jgi:HEAT repeat protein
MLSRRYRAATPLALAIVAMVTIAAACARESSAQVAGTMRTTVADDTASLSRLLSVVRGVDPLLCELMTRNVDMHGSWSHWGPLSGNPLEADSTGAALIAWIQRDHKDPAVVPRLRLAMRDSDACVRRIAGSFLGRVEHTSAVEALLGALEDPRAETRQVAAVGLGLSDSVRAIEPLVRRLRDDSPDVRRAAAWALGSLEATTALLPLIESLGRDTDPRVRQAAAWAIGRLHD